MSADGGKGTVPGSGDGGGGGSDDPRVGTTVDKYTITRVLGSGGMGKVYEARNQLSHRFAIKFLRTDLATNRDLLHRFEKEGLASGHLEHSNIASAIDSGVAPDGSPYLVLEYLHGEDCSKVLRREGPLPVERAVDIVLQACRGLAVAHRAAIIHRDLKPENLFLTKAGDGSDVVKILDFGIAKFRASEGSLLTNTGASFGTPHYMSPEQVRDSAHVDERTDVWSLGVVLYELLSGRKPFQGDSIFHIAHQIVTVDPPPLASLRGGLDPALFTLVERAMTKDLSARLRSASEMEQALSRITKRVSRVNVRATLPMADTAPPSSVSHDLASHKAPSAAAALFGRVVPEGELSLVRRSSLMAAGALILGAGLATFATPDKVAYWEPTVLICASGWGAGVWTRAARERGAGTMHLLGSFFGGFLTAATWVFVIMAVAQLLRAGSSTSELRRFLVEVAGGLRGKDVSDKMEFMYPVVAMFSASWGGGQGSYRANTNVAQDSDVAVTVCYEGAFFYNLPGGGSPADFSIVPSSATYAAFRNMVGSAPPRSSS
jgi:serine/threonine protein kinase